MNEEQYYPSVRILIKALTTSGTNTVAAILFHSDSIEDMQRSIQFGALTQSMSVRMAHLAENVLFEIQKLKDAYKSGALAYEYEDPPGVILEEFIDVYGQGVIMAFMAIVLPELIRMMADYTKPGRQYADSVVSAMVRRGETPNPVDILSVLYNTCLVGTNDQDPWLQIHKFQEAFWQLTTEDALHSKETWGSLVTLEDAFKKMRDYYSSVAHTE